MTSPIGSLCWAVMISQPLPYLEFVIICILMHQDDYLIAEKKIIDLEQEYLVFIYEDLSIFPTLTITALVIPTKIYKDSTMPGLDIIKEKYFKNKVVSFHSREIRRKTDQFKIFLNEEIYNDFKVDMINLIEKSQISIVSASINKVKLLEKTIAFEAFSGGAKYNIGDLYLMTVNFVLERLAQLIGSSTAKIIFEERGREESKKIQAMLESAKKNGTFYKTKEDFIGIDDDIYFFKKIDNVNGLQIADYCVYPFARHAKNPKDEDNKLFDLLRKFVYKGDRGEYGLKVWP